MYKLNLDRHEIVRPLFRAMDYHLAVNAAIIGATPAAIYVDHPADPRAALIIPRNSHRVYLGGSADNDAFNHALSSLFTERFASRDGSAGPVEFLVYYAPGRWEESFDLILKDYSTFQAQRQFYRLKQLRTDWKALVPDGFTVRCVDTRLLAETELRNMEQLVAEIHSESPSVDDFLRNKFGYCVQHGDILAGWCLSEYNSGARCELGIETVEGYRRRGIATITARAAIEHGLSQGLTMIGWHCWANNAGSIAVAQKVGFEKVLDYRARHCRSVVAPHVQ
jgi:RimJ/RimL family protein N-acetyltransferase